MAQAVKENRMVTYIEYDHLIGVEEKLGHNPLFDPNNNFNGLPPNIPLKHFDLPIQDLDPTGRLLA